MDIVHIEDKIGIPKYKQIVASIEDAIRNKHLIIGDQLPSINSLRDQHSLSRDTVLSAFNELKMRGIVRSVVGKGYYVSSANIETKHKIFLLFDEFNSFKEDLYNSFLNALKDTVQVDIFFHHFNSEIFNKLIENNIGAYNTYVIMPANLRTTNIIIERLPKDSVYILDQTHEEISNYASIYQNFRKDIKEGLTEANSLLTKYKKLILLFSEEKQPKEMFLGFNEFCETSTLESEVIDSLDKRELTKGEVYIIPDDRNLIRLIKKKKERAFVLGKDIGVISYNDTLLKEIVEGGITTISTDFNLMGKRLAEMITNKEHLQIENTNSLIIRNSL
ncbi:GntR family transcriptional regulator [Kordia sp.]|uniref:GntR family transcriptional regulator n=1 Tax=Kordia sp. TaxID=1965332 RepID=UPI003D6B9A4B